MTARPLVEDDVRLVREAAAGGDPRELVRLCRYALERNAYLRQLDDVRIGKAARPWHLEPFDSGLGRALSSWTKQQLRYIDVSDILVDLARAPAIGWACEELIWNTNLGWTVPSGVEWIAPTHFQFDPETDEPRLFAPNELMRLPLGKFIFHAAPGVGPLWERGFVNAVLLDLFELQDIYATTTIDAAARRFGEREAVHDRMLFAVACNAHFDVPALEETLRRDLIIPLVELNAARLAQTFGVSVEEVVAAAPRFRLQVAESVLTPAERTHLLAVAAEMGIPVDSKAVAAAMGITVDSKPE